jgi:hypothetical protein
MNATALDAAIDGLAAPQDPDMRRAAPDQALSPEGKIPLAHSAMLVVLGSGACWFFLAALVRWTFF